jgi:hypothetical protein
MNYESSSIVHMTGRRRGRSGDGNGGKSNDRSGGRSGGRSICSKGRSGRNSGRRGIVVVVVVTTLGIGEFPLELTFS